MKRRTIKLVSVFLTVSLVMSQAMLVSAKDAGSVRSVVEKTETVYAENEGDDAEDNTSNDAKTNDGTDDNAGDETDDGTGDNAGDETDDGVGDNAGDETDDGTGDNAGDETDKRIDDSSDDETYNDIDEEHPDDVVEDEEPGQKVTEPGGWVLSGKRWWYRYNSGSYPANGIYEISGTYYAFDKDGWMLTGWHKNEKGWYYFDASGAMFKGWLLSGKTWYYLDSSNGKMYEDGIYSVNGAEYAFDKSGAMVVGWYLSDKTWYYFDASGAMKKGWILSGNTWYYLGLSDGAMYAEGIFTIADVAYGFDKSGAMAVGWYLDDTTWYYFNANGAMYKGWALISGKWYYLDSSDGKMYANGKKTIDGKDYCFDRSGAMTIGWYKYSSTVKDPETGMIHKYYTWYYCEESGAVHKEWLRLDGKWYYLDPVNGNRYENNIYTIDGKNYGFDKNGVMATGWYEHTATFTNPNTGKVETYVEKYYFDDNGMPYNGWISSNGSWYWTDENGKMCADGVYKTDKGTKYSKFDANGKWLGYVDAPK